jgi:hypothetical protein
MCHAMLARVSISVLMSNPHQLPHAPRYLETAKDARPRLFIDHMVTI